MSEKLFGIAAIFILMAFPATATANDFCDQLAHRVRVGIDATYMSMEPESSLRLLHTQTKDILHAQCGENPEAAYAELRMQELGAGAAFPTGILSPLQIQVLKDTASAYLARFPESVEIATIAARAYHSPETAREAIRLSPSYPPAHAALAESLLVAGQTEDAYAALRVIHDLTILTDGYTLQARILLAMGDPEHAYQAARTAITKRHVMSFIEPDGDNMLPICQANEVLGRIYLQRRQFGKAARSLINAHPCSPNAAALLSTPPEPLRKALRQLNYNKDL